MYAAYGSYNHTPNSVSLSNVSYQTIKSGRGMRYATRVQYNLIGDLYANQALTTVAAKQADLNTKILALENAYSQDYQDFGFYTDAGALTEHKLINNHARSMTGTTVDYLRYPDGGNTEFAEKRTFAIGLSAIFLDAYSGIVEFSDSITQEGDGGPTYRWYIPPVGTPYAIQTSQASLIKVTQRGFARKITGGYPLAPVPRFGDPFIDRRQSSIKRIAPKKYGIRDDQYMGFTTEWIYTYYLPTPQLVLPSIL